MGVFSTNAELADYNYWETICGIFLATISWILVYGFFCVVNSRQSYEWNCRIVSTLHAFIVIALTWHAGCVQGPFPFTDPGGPNTKLQHWICVMCLGYFMYDLAWCIYFNTEGAVMLFHHLLSLYGQCVVLVRGRDGVEMMAVLFGSEISNPFLQFRWFFRESNRHKTWLAEINDHLFMFMFGFWRIALGSVLLYCTWIHPLPDMHAKLGGLAIYLLGWVFWIMIVDYAIRKYKKKFKAWKEQESNVQSSQEADVSKQNGVVSNGTMTNVSNGVNQHLKSE